MKKLLVTLCLLLSACERTPEDKRSFQESQAQVVGDNLFYYKDDRTNMCFAVMWLGNATSMASVPCDGYVKVIHFKSKEN